MKTIEQVMALRIEDLIGEMYCYTNAVIKDEQNPTELDDSMRVLVIALGRRVLNNEQWYDMLRMVERVECDTDFCVRDDITASIYKIEGVAA